MNDSSLVAKWTDLPQPCPRSFRRKLIVVLERSRFARIVRQHVSDTKEPWSEWLGGSLRDRLVDSFEAAKGPSSDPGKECIDRLREQLERSLDHPLTISFFRQPDDDSPKWTHLWLTILPCGLTVILRTVSAEETLISCYFHEKACQAAKSTDRWFATLKHFVNRYCRCDDQGWLAPGRTEAIDVTTPKGLEVHSGVEYCSLENWGFDDSGRWSRERVRGFQSTSEPLVRLNAIRQPREGG